ncbi:MAG: DUF4391 domain-containing protein [Microcystis sp. Msp_OC_L_20101000_S702]|uniref:DUF4391 domain-containing protein n=1 Tax=Microcystis sp. Msp_OC_L_20101000_S702 TaxID=2486218 RepID=UPI0011924093|nr:DUF4391 domain-containing protein [Microcystis sp. Msp_OC_L_20101000_S702]TRU02991.1 MAG: DUF4391 domain-containing protein [Microcystis sp. Msp_OC_L_20101000_S702]
MTVSQVIEALGLPAGARVDQRVPKKLLIENGAPTSADKKLINDGIEVLTWVAALKPTTIGVPEYRDDAREYLEIAVLALQARSSSRLNRLIELIHRAIPYPVMLMVEHPEGASLSFANKRWAQNEEGKTVLDGEVLLAPLDVPGEFAQRFLEAINLLNQPKTHLQSLYQGWISTATALRAATISGTFQVPANPSQAADQAEALRVTSQLESRIAAIRAAAAKEKQLPKQVHLNLELKRLREELASAQQRL